ncbi:MAG TPA: uracil phosphoribosyltransferase, partial [Spirochaetales bacterium]|nr:uracil phosphoribosyltransferase [Spirochaetales bacterium]
MNKVVLKAQDLDGYLNDGDRAMLERMDGLYRKAMLSFSLLSAAKRDAERVKEEGALIELYNEMGGLMQELCHSESRIKVYSFETPSESHGEASRLIAKLRDVATPRHEFTYYTQRAYELLFNLAYGGAK